MRHERSQSIRLRMMQRPTWSLPEADVAYGGDGSHGHYVKYVQKLDRELTLDSIRSGVGLQSSQAPRRLSATSRVLLARGSQALVSFICLPGIRQLLGRQ